MRNYAWLIGALGALGMVLSQLGCGVDDTTTDGDADSDADSDSDTDSDSDGDTDADGDGDTDGDLEATVSTAIEGAAILRNGDRTGRATTDTIMVNAGDEIDVYLDDPYGHGYLTAPMIVEESGNFNIPCGRILDDTTCWTCETNLGQETHCVDTRPSITGEWICVENLDGGGCMRIEGNTIFQPGQDSPAVGTVSEDGLSLEYTWGITIRCTRD